MVTYSYIKPIRHKYRHTPSAHLPFFFFLNDTAPPEIYPLPPHAALPIWALHQRSPRPAGASTRPGRPGGCPGPAGLTRRNMLQVGTIGALHLSLPSVLAAGDPIRSGEHTSELQSPCNLVCRLLLEKKKNT